MNDMQTRVTAIHREMAEAARSAGRNPEEIILVGVSKRHSADEVVKAVDAGITTLGENYIQEAVDKIETLGDLKASWHFIGHLQTNKARFAVQYFDILHTVDSVKLAREIDKRARKINKVQEILVQINISQESSKSGTAASDALALVREAAVLENVSIRGLMGMPPFFDNPEEARPFFKKLAAIRSDIRAAEIPNVSMEHLSMGMSGDFKAAIQEGATMVRIGTAIFGERQ